MEIQLSLYDGKTCTRCGFWQPFGSFFRQARGYAGRNSRCKDCTLIYKRNFAERNSQIQKTVPPSKVCNICRELKPIAEFGSMKTSPDGREYRCKPCQAERVSAFRIDNPEHALQQSRRQFQNNKENRRAAVLKYQKKIPGGWMAKYRREHPEYVAKERLKMKEWRRQNPDRAKQKSDLRRARLYSVRVETIDRKTIIERDASTCYLCQKIVLGIIHVDHVIPLSRGGSHTYDNLRVTCPQCNLRKSDRLLSEINWQTFFR